MELEVKQISKVEKETPQGIEVTVYKCVLKGGGLDVSGGVVKASLTLESTDELELKRTVEMQIGAKKFLSLRDLNHRLDEFASTKVEYEGNNEILKTATELINEFGLEGAKEIVNAARKAKENQ